MYLKSMATGATVEKMERRRRRKRKRGGRLKQRCWMQEIPQALANLNWLEVHSSMYLCVKTDSIYVPPLLRPLDVPHGFRRKPHPRPPRRNVGRGGEKPKRMESKVTKYTCVCIFKAAASPASTAAPVLSCPLLRDLDTSPPTLETQPRGQSKLSLRHYDFSRQPPPPPIQ